MNVSIEISPRPHHAPLHGCTADRVIDRAGRAPRSATLSGRELQQLVAEMLG